MRVSKWWSFGWRAVEENARAVEEMVGGVGRIDALRCAQALRAKVEVAVVRTGVVCFVLQAVLLLLYCAKEVMGRTELAVQASLGIIVREAASAEAITGAAMVVV